MTPAQVELPGVWPTPLEGADMTDSTDPRFWAKVARTATCWIWTGARKSHGYGHLSRNGRWVLAHRWAYQLTLGPIPEGYEVDHLCQNPSCVNPAHLEAVTPAENMRRVADRRTHCSNGHEYTEENVYLWHDKRYCRACHRDDARRQRERKGTRKRCAVSGCDNRPWRGLCKTHRAESA